MQVRGKIVKEVTYLTISMVSCTFVLSDILTKFDLAAYFCWCKHQLWTRFDKILKCWMFRSLEIAFQLFLRYKIYFRRKLNNLSDLKHQPFCRDLVISYVFVQKEGSHICTLESLSNWIFFICSLFFLRWMLVPVLQ